MKLFIHLQAKESLGGQLQGLCGDMNGERLFEFRGPRRCVLSSGSLMAAQYQTSDRPHCFASTSLDTKNIQHKGQSFALDDPNYNLNNCPRQEGSPTIIKMPIPSAENDDL